MKTKSRELTYYGAIFACLLVLLAGCFENPTEDFTLQIAPKALTTTVSVEIIDAASGKQIGFGGGPLVRLDVKGPGSTSVIDLTQEPTTAFETEYGIVNFGLSDDHDEPSEDSPLELLLVASANGYLTSSIPATLSKRGGNNFKIYLVNLSSPPEGVMVTTHSVGSADSTGEVLAAIDISTEYDPVTGGRASLGIPQGARVTDDLGSPLSGDLTATLVFFNYKSEESLRAFPGGFNVTLKNQAGNEEEAFFKTAGFVSYEIKDASGRKGTQFDSSLTATIEVPEGIINPETGVALLAGDSIPFWHYDVQTGVWNYESSAASVQLSSGENFILSYEISHLSMFNLDWMEPNILPRLRVRFRYNGQLLFGQSSTIKNGARPASGPGPFAFKIKRNDENSYFLSGVSVTAQNPEVIVTNAPCDIPVTLEAWGGCPYEKWASMEFANLCAEDNEVELSIYDDPSLTSLEFLDVTLKASATCPGDDVSVKPSIPVYIHEGQDDDENCKWEFGGYMQKGSLRIPHLEKERAYRIGIWYQGTWFEETHVISGSEFEYAFEFPTNLCE